MLSRYLQKRPTADDLRERGILKTGGVVAEQKEKVVKKGVAAALEGGLRRRPSLVEMEDKNMMKAEAKPADILSRTLKKRPTLSDLQDKGILKAGGVVAERKEAVVKANVASSIEMALKKRSTLEDLVDSGIIPLDAAVVSPTLASSADMLSRYLQKRPTADDLRERGILKTGGVVAEQKEKVVKKGVAAALEGGLRRRPSLVEMEDKNMMKAEAKPADILSRTLKKRPTLSDLQDKGILKAGGVVAERKERVEKSSVKATLEGFLQRRSTMDELLEKGIISTGEAVVPIEPSLMSPADALARSLKRRPTLSDMQEKGIVKPSGVVASARDRVAKSSVKASLEGFLQRRSTMDELVEAGIVSEESLGMSPTLAGPAAAISRSLARRPTADDLRDRGILPPSTVSPGADREHAGAGEAARGRPTRREHREPAGARRAQGAGPLAREGRPAAPSDRGEARARGLARRPDAEYLYQRGILRDEADDYYHYGDDDDDDDEPVDVADEADEMAMVRQMLSELDDLRSTWAGVHGGLAARRRRRGAPE